MRREEEPEEKKRKKDVVCAAFCCNDRMYTRYYVNVVKGWSEEERER